MIGRFFDWLFSSVSIAKFEASTKYFKSQEDVFLDGEVVNKRNGVVVEYYDGDEWVLVGGVK